MKKNHRRKLRNCIRKDTYKYYYEEVGESLIWLKIQEVFGKALKMPGVNLFNIENEKLIIRKVSGENSFTLIKKKKFCEDDEMKLHEILGLKE